MVFSSRTRTEPRVACGGCGGGGTRQRDRRTRTSDTGRPVVRSRRRQALTVTPGSAIATTGQRPPAAGCPGARHRSHLPPLPGIRSDQRLNDRSERIQFIVSAAARNPYPFLIPADPLSIRIHYPVRSGKAVTVTRKRPRAACCAVAGQPLGSPSRCAQTYLSPQSRLGSGGPLGPK